MAHPTADQLYFRVAAAVRKVDPGTGKWMARNRAMLAPLFEEAARELGSTSTATAARGIRPLALTRGQILALQAVKDNQEAVGERVAIELQDMGYDGHKITAPSNPSAAYYTVRELRRFKRAAEGQAAAAETPRIRKGAQGLVQEVDDLLDYLGQSEKIARDSDAVRLEKRLRDKVKFGRTYQHGRFTLPDDSVIEPGFVLFTDMGPEKVGVKFMREGSTQPPRSGTIEYDSLLGREMLRGYLGALDGTVARFPKPLPERKGPSTANLRINDVVKETGRRRKLWVVTSIIGPGRADVSALSGSNRGSEGDTFYFEGIEKLGQLGTKVGGKVLGFSGNSAEERHNAYQRRMRGPHRDHAERIALIIDPVTSGVWGTDAKSIRIGLDIHAKRIERDLDKMQASYRTLLNATGPRPSDKDKKRLAVAEAEVTRLKAWRRAYDDIEDGKPVRAYGTPARGPATWGVTFGKGKSPRGPERPE